LPKIFFMSPDSRNFAVVNQSLFDRQNLKVGPW
jgi:hypothetical protein